ncbi:unnamed protein product, partial [Amoebophrya sp. A25]
EKQRAERERELLERTNMLLQRSEEAIRLVEQRKNDFLEKVADARRDQGAAFGLLTKALNTGGAD